MSDYPLTRTKRTYNLPERTVRLVRELSAEYHLAPTQDGIIELAVDELAREIQDEHEARLWEQLARDPEILAEVAEVETLFGDWDATTWPAE